MKDLTADEFQVDSIDDSKVRPNRSNFPTAISITLGFTRDSALYLHLLERHNFGTFLSNFTIAEVIGVFVDIAEIGAGSASLFKSLKLKRGHLNLLMR